MNKLTYIISAGTLLSTLVLACSDDSSGGGGTFAGDGGTSSGGTTGTAGKGGSSNNAGKGGSNNNAGKGGSSNTTGGAGGDPNTFGGGGEDQGGNSQGGAGQGGGGQADPCETCAYGKCGTQISGCENSPDCAAILQCRQNCADQACADKCVTDNPGGKTAFEAAVQCVGGQCANECGGGGGGSGNACQTCQQAKCSAELTSCSSDQGCKDALQCANACQDQACFDACVAKSETLGKLVTCVGDQCSSDCGGGGGGGNECQTCQQDKCSAELTSCSSDQGCKDGIQCVNACQDQACFDACVAKSETLGKLVTCVGTNCATPCGGLEKDPGGPEPGCRARPGFLL